MTTNFRGLMIAAHNTAKKNMTLCPVPWDLRCPRCLDDAPKLWETQDALESYEKSSRIRPEVDDAIVRLRDFLRRSRAKNARSDDPDRVRGDVGDRTRGRRPERPRQGFHEAPKCRIREDTRASERDSDAGASPDRSPSPGGPPSGPPASTSPPERYEAGQEAAETPMPTQGSATSEVERLRLELELAQARTSLAEEKLAHERALHDARAREERILKDLVAAKAQVQAYHALKRSYDDLQRWATDHWKDCHENADAKRPRSHADSTDEGARRRTSDASGAH
jgi:hypothetical protein